MCKSYWGDQNKNKKRAVVHQVCHLYLFNQVPKNIYKLQKWLNKRTFTHRTSELAGGKLTATPILLFCAPASKNCLMSRAEPYIHIRSKPQECSILNSEERTSPTCWWAHRSSRLLYNLCNRCSWWSVLSGYRLRSGDSLRYMLSRGQELQSGKKK